MKPKYNIGDELEVLLTGEKTTIADFEIFDTVVLYYTEDKKAYPEDRLAPIGTKWLTYFFNLSEHEKNRMMLESMGPELD